MKFCEALKHLVDGKQVCHPSVPNKTVALGRETKTVLVWVEGEDNTLWEPGLEALFVDGWELVEEKKEDAPCEDLPS